MKIQYASDLHLEWGNIQLPGGDTLILAGDVCEERKITRHRAAWQELTPEEKSDPKYIDLYRCWTFFEIELAKYTKVFMVMGNHCHYHGKFHKTYDKLKEILPDNVTLLEKEAVDYEGVMFLGGTMWTNCNNGDSLTTYTLKASMNDYRVIQNYYEDKGLYFKLTPEYTFREHIKTLRVFEEVLKQHSDKKCVVITHHAPSFMSISEQYKGPGDFHMNGGYASDLSEFILDHPQIKKWIHGHVHSSHQYMIGETEILCNPRGYKGHESQAEEFEVKSFEI